MAVLTKPKIRKVLSDAGVLGNDALTNDNTLTLVGKAAPRARIFIYDNGVKIGVVKADNKGNWSFDTGVLSDGHNDFSAKAKVGKKTSGFSKHKAVDVDATSPPAPSKPDLAAASDTGASSTDNITQDNTPTLTGTAEAGSTVTIKDGASVLGTTIANSAGAWSFTTRGLGEGPHALTATATDKAGNTGPASGSLAVTIDTSPPPKPSKPDLAAASDTGISSTDNITRDTTPTLTGTAEAGSTVTIRDGASVLGTTVANSAGAWSFTTGGLGEGPHALTATATDKAGNTGPASAALAVTIDATLPTATIVVSDSALAAGETSPVTITFSEAVIGFTNADLTVEGGTLSPVVSVDGGITWTATLTPTADLTDATNVITLDNTGVTDTAGNAGTGTTTSNTYAIDTVLPTTPSTPDLAAASDTGVPDDENTSDDTPTFTGTADTESVIRLYSDGVEVGSGVAEGGNWSITSSQLAEGNHTVTATATNAAGNVSAVSGGLIVTIDTSAPSAPSITTAGGLTHNSTPTVEGTAEAGSLVTLFEGTAILGTTIADGGGDWTITVPSGLRLSDDLHTLTATATDPAGNASPASDGVTFQVDARHFFTLTVDPDTVAAAVDDLTVSGLSTTLNATDNLDGGDGYDVLQLFGSGTFDLSTLVQFTGFEEVDVTNISGGSSSLKLRNGSRSDGQYRQRSEQRRPDLACRWRDDAEPWQQSWLQRLWLDRDGDDHQQCRWLFQPFQRGYDDQCRRGGRDLHSFDGKRRHNLLRVRIHLYHRLLRPRFPRSVRIDGLE